MRPKALSWVETNLEQGRKVPRARSKNADCYAVNYSRKDFFFSNIYILFNIFDSNCKTVF